jgi:hypothetical protein
MSSGVDVAPLYGDVLQAVESASKRDVRQTRLVYLYLSAVDAPSPDLSLLLVNSLHKHSRDASPVLRHEAVRALAAASASLDYAQFVAPVLSRLLDDAHPLVRRGATLAALVCARAKRDDAAVCADLSAALNSLVDDRDELVALNAVLALCQLHGAAFVVPTAAVVRLLAAGASLPDMSRAYVNELILRIALCSDEQRIALLNALDPLLEHAEACVATSAAAAMLHLCRDTPLLGSVCARLVAPLAALVAHPANDASHYLAMRHLALILPRVAEPVFDVNLLYVGHTDAPFVQIEKARLLGVAATDKTAQQCIDLLAAALRVAEPVSVVDAVLGALVQIAVRLPKHADDVRRRLLAIGGSPARRSVAVVRCAELFAARPDLADSAALQCMSEHFLSLRRDALCALLGVIAQVGPVLPDGAALLFEALNLVRDEPAHADDSQLLLQLLDASLRCFADAGAAYSRVAIDTLQLCLASDDARLRQRAEMAGVVLSHGKAHARTAFSQAAPRATASAPSLHAFNRSD